MTLLQKRRVRKGSGYDAIPITCQQVAYIWCAEAVAHADELGLFPSGIMAVAVLIALCNSLDPSRDLFIRKSRVLPLPGLVVKVRIRCVVPVLAVFPYRVLSILALSLEITPSTPANRVRIHTPRK
jgi:hypothetical protein